MRKAFVRLNRVFHLAATVLLLMLLPVGLVSDAYPQGKSLEQKLEVLTADKRFSIGLWEASALADKAWQAIRGGPADDQGARQVREFFDLVSQIQQLRGEAERLAGEEPLPEAQLAGIQTRLRSLYERRDNMENQAENILAVQVTRALLAEQLRTRVLWWDTIWPPVTSEFVDLPMLLVVSPRNRIERRVDYLLLPDLSVSEMEAIENAIQEMNYSGLVTRIGGLSTYPAMIPEIYGLEFILETMPHEWVHDFLAFYPLGWKYGSSGPLTTMNETVCDIVGSEVGQYLARQYYPEYARVEATESSPPSSEPSKPPEYDFGAEMRKTRLRADELLAQGKVDEAEAYMEERREELADHGYYIRKLNQAYFAFHGTYATGPISVDPIGPQLKEFRKRSASLREFLLTLAQMDSYQQLLQKLGLPLPTPTATQP